ncbi:MAG TPA: 4-alpha-glucanotransferase [Stellaceae bacterium]|jgi:4-alpha-glucanotransferase
MAEEQNGPSALDRLAERMGIVASFRNARGATVRTDDATKRSLLGAMGVKAADEDEARASLDALERERWLHPLPPVAVLRDEAGGTAVKIVMPSDTGEVAWRVVLEDGAERSGQAEFAGLALAEEHVLDGRTLQRRRLELGAMPLGYHRLSIETAGGAMSLVVVPAKCWLPAEGRRMWGIAIQLYLLCSASNWGIGDFGDLRALVGLAAVHGADVIGLNPLHALFSDDPEHASPYAPASRLLLNILNIDIGAVPELDRSPEAQALIASPAFQRQLQSCRSQHLVDYAGVTALKLEALEALFETSRGATDGARWEAFAAFRQRRGVVLERNCLFQALREHFAHEVPPAADWHDWPEEYRDPGSPAVARFAETQRTRIDFLTWLQWVADDQLGAAAAAAREGGMKVGLYRDLAVGADRAGAETWADAAAVISGAQVGCPPDLYNPAGQNWGLPPFHPRALRDEGYRSFIELVRANMRHAGGLRIDHVMGLHHLYWVPSGQSASAGAYVRYPTEDLIGILALESQRHRCLVVGEDLGTVPEGFRERMAAANILSYRVLFFEQTESGEYLPPEAYPALSLSVVGSHDLPTLRGWWEGGDIALKEHLDLYPDAGEAARQRETRRRDQGEFVAALRREGLLPADGVLPDIPSLSRAAHAYLARTPSMLAMTQIDDLTDEAEPVNVPTTSDEHANWRRRLSMTLEALAERPRFVDIADILRSERGGANGTNRHG